MGEGTRRPYGEGREAIEAAGEGWVGIGLLCVLPVPLMLCTALVHRDWWDTRAGSASSGTWDGKRGRY